MSLRRSPWWICEMARDWIGALLRRLKAPDTVRNRLLLSTWNRVEGGDDRTSAKFNWLSTNRGGQYPAMDPIGNRIYPNFETGIEMTARSIEDPTLQNRGILAALRSGNPDLQHDRALQASLNNWKFGDPNMGFSYYIKDLLSTWGQPLPEQHVSTVPLKPPKPPPPKKVARPIPDLYATALEAPKIRPGKKHLKMYG